MEKVTDSNDCELKDNQLFGAPKLVNTTITFHGKGNILYCQKGVKLMNSALNFMGDHSIIFLCANRGGYLLGIQIYHNSVVYIGADNYMVNGRVNISVSEQQNVLIGNDGMYSFDCWLRTADPHLLYDSNTHKRINYSKSILIGDHVWLGQHVYILKGSTLGSGCIVGAGGIVSGKTLESNAVYAGNPVKRVRQDVFFTGACVHAYQEEDTRLSSDMETDDYIYHYQEEEALPLKQVDETLKALCGNVDKKLAWMKKNLMENHNKNRFSIAPVKSSRRNHFPFFKKKS